MAGGNEVKRQAANQRKLDFSLLVSWQRNPTLRPSSPLCAAFGVCSPVSVHRHGGGREAENSGDRPEACRVMTADLVTSLSEAKVNAFRVQFDTLRTFRRWSFIVSDICTYDSNSPRLHSNMLIGHTVHVCMVTLLESFGTSGCWKPGAHRNLQLYLYLPSTTSYLSVTSYPRYLWSGLVSRGCLGKPVDRYCSRLPSRR